jgi:thiosulfate/3-mercaptopyruvate sulfurtransferase
MDAGAGHLAFLDAHIPTAHYANLDNNLSGQVTVSSGRHPLPSANQFAGFLSHAGWQPGKTLVAYDDTGGIIAARLWWLMKYFGQDNAALLDGGLPAWLAAGFELESGQKDPECAPVERLEPLDEMLLSSSQIADGLKTNKIHLIDARAANRFYGEAEPIDSRAGHIPGACNHPCSQNLLPDGRFKPPGELRTALNATRVEHKDMNMVHMCGSGVTACHNIFAEELVGLQGSRLYAGSWSEWIRDPSRPIVTVD